MSATHTPTLLLGTNRGLMDGNEQRNDSYSLHGSQDSSLLVLMVKSPGFWVSLFHQQKVRLTWATTTTMLHHFPTGLLFIPPVTFLSLLSVASLDFRLACNGNYAMTDRSFNGPFLHIMSILATTQPKTLSETCLHLHKTEDSEIERENRRRKGGKKKHVVTHAILR